MDNTRVAAAHKITARVLALIAAGLAPVDALKVVCGAENVDAMIDALYTQLRGEVR